MKNKTVKEPNHDRDKLKNILKIFKANMLDEDQTIFAIQKVRFHNFYAIPEKDFIEISNLLRIAKSIAPQNTE